MCKELKTIHELDCHETVFFDGVGCATHIIRVPGGWLYQFCDAEGNSTAFVPFNTEFSGRAELYEVGKLEQGS
jgi:hypothetical protein